MAELAVQQQPRSNVIQFPQQDGNAEITMSQAQLEALIQKTVAAAKAKTKPKYERTDSIYKTNGIRKASASQPLRNSAEYQDMCDYLLNNGHQYKRVRNYVLVALGCSLGLRISDLLKLTVGMCFDKDGNVRSRLSLVERKTRKKNDHIIITSTGAAALEMWKTEYGLEHYEYIFFSDKSGSAMSSHNAWVVIKNAARAIGLQGTYGTHMLRKTFGYQSFQAAQEVGLGGQALELLQAKYNHSDQRTTMRYACISDDMIQEMAEAASARLTK